MSVPCTYNLPP